MGLLLFCLLHSKVIVWGDFMDCKEMGSRIKKARLNQNLTQEQLAELLDMSVSYVSLIERGSRNATVETLLNIADVLHVSVASLLQDSTDLDRDEEQNNIWYELTKNRTWEEKDMILQTVKTIVTFLDHQKK